MEQKVYTAAAERLMKTNERFLIFFSRAISDFTIQCVVDIRHFDIRRISLT